MKTVLAIDDDKTTLGILESQLGSLGFRVYTERSAVKGVEIAKEFPPDVILLDLNMPVMTGFEVMSSLRREKSTKDIPVIMLTVSKERESVIEAMRHGAVDYMVKPYSIDKLVLKIKSAISYGGDKKQQNMDVFIEITRKGEIAVITMKGGIREKGFQNDVRTVFNPFFMKQVHGKTCIFDIKEMNDFTDEDIRELERIVSMFPESKVKVVTGKHYGTIVGGSDLDEKVELFLSFGDLELALA
ncbi:MAG TPA: response regulator [Spirochaetota bacterium]|nr:response regulator [Spirochaetota bacterium]HPJ36564.1 response regulator [Spirochaetota bacterium]